VNAVAQVAIHILEAMFIVGIIGSLLVVLLTFVEDVEVWFKPQENGATEPDHS